MRIQAAAGRLMWDMNGLRLLPTGTWRLSRLAWWRDLALPVGIAVVAILGTALIGGEHHHASPNALIWLAVTIGPAALVLRRRHPVAALWTAFAATLLTASPGFAFLSLVVAFFAAAGNGHRKTAWIVIAVGYIAAVWLVPLAWDQPVTSVDAALLLAAWLTTLVVASEALRMRRERTIQARAARKLDGQRRASEERLKMARELHDVIGHTISLINVQAGAALDLIDTRPEQARIALAAIKQVSKEALDELRMMLTALRDGDEKAPRAPTPGLERLSDLVSLTAAAGVQVTTDVVGQPRVIPAAVDLAAYRIAQEALTNVVRHAGPTTVTVRVAYGKRDLRIDVADDGRHTGPECKGSVGTGSGLPGMRERIAALGGHLDAGPSAGGGFRVHAVLPLDGRR
jgi:signal transduction histidine kinase